MKWKPDWMDIAENLLIGLVVVVRGRNIHCLLRLRMERRDDRKNHHHARRKSIIRLLDQRHKPESIRLQANRGREHEGDKSMNGDKQHAVWRESIEKYGKETQSIVCMEECSELIQAVSKRLRGKPGATDNLAEEMADVIICLYLLKEMYGITDEQLNEWITRKTARQSKRMQADDPFMESEDAE